MKLLLLLASFALALGAQTAQSCRATYLHGKLGDARACYTTLSRSANPALRAEGLWGLGDHKGANEAFRIALQSKPDDADVRVRWGRLFLDHNQPGDAAALFQEALEKKADYAPALLGLALAAADGFENKAVELAESALKADPKLVEARELLARLALEDGDEKRAAEQADKALELSPEALDAMAVRASIDWLNDKPDSPWMTRILAIDPVYGEAYTTGAKFFVLNRRYEEAIRHYRKALELNPNLLGARAELGIQLMRLGDEAGARKELEACYEAGYFSKAVTNALTLLDSYANYKTFRTPRTVLRLHKKEADLLRPYVQAEMERALATYEKKYRLKLTKPVQLEVYPDHGDLEVRTIALPEAKGILGVTFGSVVAMDSPSARRAGSFHWASTMWHELSHVYVLTATNGRAPRWFTEGMAVHEETAVSPEWGDRLDPEAIKAISESKLLPIAELDRGFVRPKYPAQVTVSYFQAGRICDYINQRWGYEKLLAMIKDFGERKTTPAVIEQELGMKPEQFDREFQSWLREKTGRQVAGFGDWRKRLRGIAQAAGEKKWDDVIAEGNAIRDIYPDYVEAGSVYEFLWEAYSAKGEGAKAAAELEAYAHAGGRSPELLKKLATLQAESGRKKDAAATLARLNFIAPNDEDLHRRLGALLAQTGDAVGAVREWQAVVAMKPVDPAGANFELAKALRDSGRKDDAREAVLNALEAAPGFKPAQRLLLELDGKD